VLAVVGIGALASCSVVTGTRAATRSDRTPQVSVTDGRFAASLDLDGGALTVDAPAPSARPELSLSAATTLFRAADAVDGTFEFSVLGLGVVTLEPPPSAPPTTAAPATTTSTTHAAATTTSTTPSGGASTGTGAPGATTTAAGGPGLAALPTYDHRLAWVGMAWDGACPAAGGAPGAAPGARSTLTPLEPGGATRFVVVVFDAGTGRDAVAYTSRGPASCGGPVQPSSATRPDELLSVPWTAVGPTSTAVQVALPACATYDGWTELGAPSAGAVEVLAKVPYDPSCGTPAGSEVVSDVVPLGSGAQVPHAPVGPLQAERTLPGGSGGGRAQTALAG